MPLPEGPGGTPYHRLHRLGAPGEWRPFVGVVVALLLLGGLLPTLVLTVVTPGNLDGHPATPRFLAATNLVWALGIAVACGVTWWVHRVPARWLFSVVGRMRWGWLLSCLGLALVTLAVTVWVSAVLPSQGEATVEMSGHLNAWTDRVRDFVLVIVLLTPLQAAGEEFVFRGYLTQAVGSLGTRLRDTTRAAIAVVVPAFLFGLAHGIGQGLPVFFDRFAFGLVAGVLVIVTGGLEAGIAMHVLNNFVAFGLALAYGDMTTALHATGGSWWTIPVTLTQSLLYLGLCWWLSRRKGLDRRTREGVLEAPEAAM